MMRPLRLRTRRRRKRRHEKEGRSEREGRDGTPLMDEYGAVIGGLEDGEIGGDNERDVSRGRSRRRGGGDGDRGRQGHSSTPGTNGSQQAGFSQSLLGGPPAIPFIDTSIPPPSIGGGAPGFGRQGDRAGSFGPQGDRAGSFGPQGDRPGSFGPQGDRPGSFGPQGDRSGPFGPQGDRAGSFGPMDRSSLSYPPLDRAAPYQPPPVFPPKQQTPYYPPPSTNYPPTSPNYSRTQPTSPTYQYQHPTTQPTPGADMYNAYSSPSSKQPYQPRTSLPPAPPPLVPPARPDSGTYYDSLPVHPRPSTQLEQVDSEEEDSVDITKVSPIMKYIAGKLLELKYHLELDGPFRYRSDIPGLSRHLFVAYKMVTMLESAGYDGSKMYMSAMFPQGMADTKSALVSLVVTGKLDPRIKGSKLTKMCVRCIRCFLAYYTGKNDDIDTSDGECSEESR